MYSFRCLILRMLTLTAVLGLTQSLQSQTYVNGTGLPSFATSQPVELGVLDVANGNLHLELSVASPPQRGSLNVGERLVYDSRLWTIVNNGSSQVWQPNSQTASWRFADLRRSGTVTYSQQGPFNCSNGQGTYVTYSSFVWHKPDGTNIQFPVQTTQGCGTDSPTSQALAADASGLSMFVSNFTQAFVTDTTGVQIYDVPTDANGNYITHNSNSDAIDTVGRVPVVTTISGNQTYLDVLNSQNGHSRYTLNYSSINVSTAFGQSGVTEYSGTLSVISSIQLPNGTSYQFGYDGYGELNSITLPTGGQITYGYTNFSDAYGQINRWATSRTSGSGTWSYTPTVISTCPSGGQNCQQKVTVTKPSNDSIQYVFTMNGGAWNSQVTYIDHSGAQLAAITNTWDTSQTCNGCTGAAYVKKLTSVTSLNIPGGTISKQSQYTYDGSQTNNITAIKEWNFYTGSPGANPDRETDIQYYNPGFHNITSLPTSITVKNGSGTQISQTLYTYDRYDLTGLSSVTGVVQHDDTDFGLGTTARGNLTTVQKWINGTTYVTTAKYWYDTTGQIMQMADAAGNAISYSYADNYYSDNGSNPPASFAAGQITNAYATTATLPLIGSSTAGYYYGSGKLSFQTDQNGRTAFAHFMDSLDRPTVSVNAIGGWVENVYTSATQTDEYTGITDTIPSSGCSGCRHDETVLDNLGRLSNSILVSDPDGQINNISSFDANGRVSSATNPYRSTSDPTYGSTSSTYDGLDRVIQITRPDGNIATATFGASLSSATSVCGVIAFPSVSTDEAGIKRQYWTDGFGRLLEVEEPDSGGNFSIATCYAYDAGNRLTSSTQRGGDSNSANWRVRSYSYDGLSRVTSRTTPESGTTTFAFTSAGAACSGDPSLPCSRTDARNIITTYSYDALNRLTGKSYSDTTTAVAYYYDQTSYNGLTITNGKGRRTGMSDGSGQTAWSYDANGNVLTKRQTIAGVANSTSYSYNRDGSVATMTSPSGHVYTYGYSNAMRPVSLSDSGSGITYVSGAHYAAPGQLTSASHGLNLAISESNSFNNRLEPTVISATAPSETVFSLSYNWTLPNGKNNGSVYQIQNNRDNTRSVQYAYDQLNRLATAETYNASTWGDAYLYDNWGNLLQKNVTQGTAETLQVTVDPHNHINTSGFTYDTAGNLTWDGHNSLKFDAENRVNPTTGYVYSYDGDDHRVEKNNSGSITYYWYDDNFTVITTTGAVARDYVYFNGRRIAFLGLSTGNQHYYWNDHLRSSGVMSNSSGSTIEWEGDYYPFGTPRVLNNSVENKFRFTGYEWDAETGYSYADYREQSPNLGRFFSPDRLLGDSSNPQSLNMYAYALNNPTNIVDPFGLCGESSSDDDCIQIPYIPYVFSTTVMSTPLPPDPPAPSPEPPVQISFVPTFNPGPIVTGGPGSTGGGSGGASVQQAPPTPPPDVPKSDAQIQKENACGAKALAAAGLAGATDFIGLPANFGNFGPSFAGTSPDDNGGVHVTAGDVALILKDPSVEMAMAGMAVKALPTVASTFAVRAIPVVGWALTGYQAAHAAIAAYKEYQKTYEECMSKP